MRIEAWNLMRLSISHKNSDIGLMTFFQRPRIVISTKCPKSIAELRQAGVHAAFNFYNEAGLGFAEHAWSLLERRTNETTGDD